MELLILSLGLLMMLCLAAENFSAAGHRSSFRHVVHVNGIRGKSSVTRLIAAGLRGGGFRVFCKTTGTLPMTIDVNGKEELIHRRGKANIREQMKTMRQAATQNTEILVIECMAVNPELQAICQHRILKADYGVITNVRLDHTAEMGPTLPQICKSLCNTVPKNGTLFTADEEFFPQMQKFAEQLKTKTILAQPQGELLPDDFPENVALALKVCETMGVSQEDALKGMAHVQHDPYAVSCHQLCGGGLFLNGMSANDPQSTKLVLERFSQRCKFSGKLILLINNRPDRGYRTQMMTSLAEELAPAEIWLLGASQWPVEHALKKKYQGPVRCFSKASELPLSALDGDYLLYAIGNIALQGITLMERVKQEGKPYVW